MLRADQRPRHRFRVQLLPAAARRHDRLVPDGGAELQPVPLSFERGRWPAADSVATMTLTDVPPTTRPGRRIGRTLLVWLLVLPGAAWAVIRLGGWERGPLIQLFAFTPYVAVWSLIPALIALFARRWLAASIAAVTVALFATAVLPPALPGPEPGPPPGGELPGVTAHMLGGGAPPAALLAPGGKPHRSGRGLPGVPPAA